MQAAFDAVLLFCCSMLAVLWLGQGYWPAVESAVPSALLFALTALASNAVVGLYQRNGCRTAVQAAARVILSLLLAVPIAYGAFRLLGFGEVPQEALKLAAFLALGAMLGVRGFVSRSGATPAFVRRTLVLGTGSEADTVEESLKQMGPSVTVVGFYPVQASDVSTVAPGRILPGSVSLLETARRQNVQEIIVALRERRGGALPINQLLECKLAGIQVLDLSSFYERALGQVRLDSLRASWLIFGGGFRQGLVRTVVKRVFDIVASSVLLVLALPLMLVTALLILLDSGFPILYRQERVGRAGRVFHVIKFRSMVQDAERDGAPRWAKPDDGRTTRVGRVIRKLRIDELPQLINVLKGDMSLVGPRPERPQFVDTLAHEIPFYAARHSVKPGVTGWAQVRYQYGASVQDAAQKLQYDLYYVKNHTLFLDIVILFETVGVVLSGEGAH